MDLHGKIMNIQPMMNDTMYNLGHRDPRHSAAELAVLEKTADCKCDMRTKLVGDGAEKGGEACSAGRCVQYA